MATFVNAPDKAFKVSVFGGMRQGLFAPAVSVNTNALAEYSVQVERRIAEAVYQCAREARDKARANAPVGRTGELRAGIYVTAPGSQADISAFRTGKLKPGQQPLRSHSRAYYHAINRVAKMRDSDVPGSEDYSVTTVSGGNLIDHRTQRLSRGLGRADVVAAFERESLLNGGGEGEDPQMYIRVASVLPFNSLGSTPGRASFFVGIGSAMYYSAWVEFGTSKMPAHQFFTPAAEWLVAEAPKRIASAMSGMRLSKATQARIQAK